MTEASPGQPVPAWGAVRRALPFAFPALVVAVGAYWTVLAGYRETFAILGRDPGIFQYVAWAIGRGERDYIDIREINGPLPHLIHMVLLRLGGGDEHVFRSLDLAAEALVFAFAGALLPGIGRRPGDPRVRPLARAGWAAAGAVVLTAQYLVHDWWQTAQRESFYDLFLIASIAVQLYAQTPASPASRRAPLLAAAGALSAVTFFGKPTCLSFTGLQVLVFLADRERTVPSRRGLAAFGAGCAAAVVGMVVFTFAVGDPGRGVHIVFGEVPRLYRWIWKISPADAYVIWNNAPKLNYALATLVPVLVLVAARRLPRRLLLPAALLVGGLVNFFVQGKGFPYHLHPITLGTHYVWLAVAAYAVDRAEVAEGPRAGYAAAALLGVAGLLGFQSMTEARLSEYAKSDWWRVGATPEARASEAYFRRFPWGDYFPWELRQAARFVDEHTGPDDRVQTYGMDPYFLYLAGRRSATPYVYSFELNIDAALQGGSGGAPGPAERAWLLDTAHQHETELLAGLEKAPPAAFTLIDRAPFTYPTDAVADLRQHCPRVAAWMQARYHEAATFGAVRVWLPGAPTP